MDDSVYTTLIDAQGIVEHVSMHGVTAPASEASSFRAVGFVADANIVETQPEVHQPIQEDDAHVQAYV